MRTYFSKYFFGIIFLFCSFISRGEFNWENNDIFSGDSISSEEPALVHDAMQDRFIGKFFIGAKAGVNILTGDGASFNYLPGLNSIIRAAGFKSNVIFGYDFSNNFGVYLDQSIINTYRGAKDYNLLFINDTTNYRGIRKDVRIGSQGAFISSAINLKIDLYKSVFKGNNPRVKSYVNIGMGCMYFAAIQYLKEDVAFFKDKSSTRISVEKYKIISQVGFENEINTNISLTDDHLSMEWDKMPELDDLKKGGGKTVFILPIGFNLEYSTSFNKNIFYSLHFEMVNTFTDELDAYKLPTNKNDNLIGFSLGIKYEF